MNRNTDGEKAIKYYFIIYLKCNLYIYSNKIKLICVIRKTLTEIEFVKIKERKLYRVKFKKRGQCLV